MNKRERPVGRTQFATENPLEGEELFLDAMFGVPGTAGRQERGSVRDEKTKGSPRPGELATNDGAIGTGAARGTKVRATAERATIKPQHYKIVSISLYNEDIERLNTMVRELKRRGHYKANKSQLIRYALAKLDVDQIPKEL